METEDLYAWVPIKEYEHLKERDRELTLLENAGVDNWEWYGDALRGEIE